VCHGPTPNPGDGGSVPPVSDPILPFLAFDVVALLLLGRFASLLPLAACGFVAAALCGLGALLCLPPLLLGLPPTALALPVGPPGLSLHLALDPLATAFLLNVFLAGTVISAFQASSVPLTKLASVQTSALCLAGIVCSLIAADGVSLAIGIAITCGAMNGPRHRTLMLPLLVLTAVCLLTPAGFAPGFEAIGAAPADPNHATAAGALALLAVAGLIRLGWVTPDPAKADAPERCWTRDALTAGALLPFTAYLLSRLLLDLSGTAGQAWFGLLLLLAGGAAAVADSWRAAADPDIVSAIAALIRRQAGLAMTGIGLALVARAADLPDAAALALQAVFLMAIGGSLAGPLTLLAAHAIGASAGTYRLSRLGGLVHTMPATSAALAAGLLALCALPPSFGFAALWLLFQSILSAPRTGGLPSQLPLALTAAALALSAALATTASVRLIGIALLGRPRTPRGSGARESQSPVRTILLTLAGLSLAVGMLPGATLWLLADPAIRGLTGVPQARPALLAASGAAQGYVALPVLALIALATGVGIMTRRSLKEAKIAGLWADGMKPPAGLPFGEPAAQSTGAGFLPALPAMKLPWMPRMPRLAIVVPARPPSAIAGLWLVLTAFGLLLLVLAATG